MSSPSEITRESLQDRISRLNTEQDALLDEAIASGGEVDDTLAQVLAMEIDEAQQALSRLDATEEEEEIARELAEAAEAEEEATTEEATEDAAEETAETTPAESKADREARLKEEEEQEIKDLLEKFYEKSTEFKKPPTDVKSYIQAYKDLEDAGNALVKKIEITKDAQRTKQIPNYQKEITESKNKLNTYVKNQIELRLTQADSKSGTEKERLLLEARQMFDEYDYQSEIQDTGNKILTKENAYQAEKDLKENKDSLKQEVTDAIGGADEDKVEVMQKLKNERGTLGDAFVDAQLDRIYKPIEINFQIKINEAEDESKLDEIMGNMKLGLLSELLLPEKYSKLTEQLEAKREKVKEKVAEKKEEEKKRILREVKAGSRDLNATELARLKVDEGFSENEVAQLEEEAKGIKGTAKSEMESKMSSKIGKARELMKSTEYRNFDQIIAKLGGLSTEEQDYIKKELKDEWNEREIAKNKVSQGANIDDGEAILSNMAARVADYRNSLPEVVRIAFASEITMYQQELNRLLAEQADPNSDENVSKRNIDNARIDIINMEIEVLEMREFENFIIKAKAWGKILMPAAILGLIGTGIGAAAFHAPFAGAILGAGIGGGGKFMLGAGKEMKEADLQIEKAKLDVHEKIEKHRKDEEKRLQDERLKGIKETRRDIDIRLADIKLMAYEHAAKTGQDRAEVYDLFLRMANLKDVKEMENVLDEVQKTSLARF